ncbi:MAG: ParB/RepB/Spo0J family partition protein [Anaerolineae bacterium]|jgi:ParB family chromosome partitioning protein|nr:ParB/RepB/Spo0J family partition protein [Anaerolineae bacterium]MDH7472920.1 ParB/RepB/Spo0J family partition protein [Anaerolineae bacterium]
MVKRARVTSEDAQRALGVDLLDRILEGEGLAEVIEVPISQIDPNPFQPRQDFGTESLEELAASIRAQGFYGHLVARRAGERYQLAYGERRLRAAQMAGLSELPLSVRDLSDGQMLEVAITENVQRKDLNPIEEAEAYNRLVQLGYSYRQISDKVGKSAGHISDLLKLLQKPDVAEQVRQGEVGIVEGREIAKIEDADIRQELLEKVSRGELDREGIKIAVSQVQPAARTFNPLPILKAAQRKIESLQLDLLSELEPASRNQVRQMLQTIIAQATALLEHLQQE